ncbi:hypothetical protein ONZ45_g7414 [Pleurotus djamor]|nr:hypothetical protein ONZ45_g7414 [Pleurotus djamor]
MNARTQSKYDFEIASLSSMIQHAQTKGESVHSDTYQELQRLKDQTNTPSSISKLPDELLSTIFEETKRIYIQKSRRNAELDPSNASSYRKSQSSWLDIAKVCRRWSEVAFRNPRLWSDIKLNDQIECIQEMLRRSKSAPLTVWCRVHVYDAVFQGRAAEVVMPHFSRFEELNVIAASLQSAREFLELIPDVRNVPHLRLFRLDVVKAQEDDEDDDDDDESASTLIIPKHVIQSHLPNLHTLDLEYGSFATQLPFLPSLAFLTFSCALASPRLRVRNEMKARFLRLRACTGAFLKCHHIATCQRLILIHFLDQ